MSSRRVQTQASWRIPKRAVLIGAISCVLALTATGCGNGGSESAASRECRGLKNFAESAHEFATFLAAKRFNLQKFDAKWVGFQVVDGPDAPDAIRADVHVLADASSKFVDAIARVDVSNLDQESLDELQELWTKIDQQRIAQASTNISAWVHERCA